MPTIIAKDGARIFYKDWGGGRPVVFSHGWPPETDFNGDLPKIDIPVLVAHGDDDQIVPIQAAALKTVKLLPNATLKVYSGAPHGLNGAYEREFNNDLLAFLAD